MAIVYEQRMKRLGNPNGLSTCEKMLNLIGYQEKTSKITMRFHVSLPTKDWHAS